MGNAQCTIGYAAADIDNLDICVVVAYIVSNLLQAAQRGEVGDRVCNCDISFHGDAAGNTGHVLLHDAAVIIAFREFLGKTLNFAITDVCQDHMDSGVFFCQLQKDFIEYCSHDYSTPSSL